MASYIGKTFKLSNYLAGAWSYRVFDQILWEPVPDPSPDAGPLSRPKTYQAHSWSWASINYPIKFTTPRYPSLAELKEGVVFKKDPKQEYGEVDFGALVLRGPLIATGVYQQLKPIGASKGGFQDSLAKEFVCAPLAFTNPHKGVVSLVLVPTEVNEIEDLPTELRKYRRAGTLFELSKNTWAQYKSRPVKMPYTVGRGPEGQLVQHWPNVPKEEPNLEDEDRNWFQENAVDFLAV